MTKSEIIEARERLEKALETIKKWLPCVDSNLMVYVMIPPALEDMNRELKPLLTHIMDNDDYNLAIKINKDITPVWNDYSDNVNSKRLEASEATWEVNTLIKRLRKWEKEYEEEHPQQPDTPNNTPSAKDEGEDKPTKGIIDTDKLQTLFTDSFFAKDYNIQDTHNKSLKLSRYDKLCQRLEMILTDTDKKPDQKTIGAIAYMIYCSPYTKAEYRKPKREGTKGGFANLIRIFFDIVGKDHPSDTRPNKYKKPIEDMVLYFGDILKWE